MIKNKKGFTLTEVLVAVAVIGVAVTMFAVFISSYYRIDYKFRQKENIINESKTIINIFTGDPKGFFENINALYQTSNNKIYYDNAFERELNYSDHFILYDIVINDDIYQLKITIYKENILDNEISFTRQVRGYNE